LSEQLIVSPLFYVMKRGLEDRFLDAIEDALSITPCQAVVISDTNDASTAMRYAPMVLRADDDVTALAVAREWALKTGRPLLVIGAADFLEAVYPDGHTETIGSEHVSAVSN